MARAASASGAILGILAALLTALFLFGAREPLDLVPDFDGAQLPDDLDAYLAGREGLDDPQDLLEAQDLGAGACPREGKEQGSRERQARKTMAHQKVLPKSKPAPRYRRMP